MKTQGKIITAKDAYGVERTNIRKMILPRTNTQGQTKIIVEVCQYIYRGEKQYETKFKRVGTNVWINPKHWDKKKEVIKPQDPEYITKNKTIDRVYMDVKTYVDTKGQTTPDQVYINNVSLDVLRDLFPSKPQNKKTLIEYIDEYIEYRRQGKTVLNTLKKFITLKNRVEAFDTYKKTNSHIENIDLVWSDAFYLFLLNEKKYQQNTIERTYVALKTCVNYYYERRKRLGIEVSDEFKYKSFKRGTQSPNDPNPLTRDQVNTLYLHTFDEEYLNKTKDRFIWQCFTALRYIDAFVITKKDIETFNGIEHLWYLPSKTERHTVRVEQPLNPVSKELLEKYNYDMSQLKITNQVYNRELKVMFKKLNEKYPDLHYDENFGSYASRDTFISWCVENGVSWHNILKYTGQSSFSIMNRYTKTSNELKQKEMNVIFAKPVAK